MSLCQCWLHSSWCTPVLTLLCCQSPIMVPGGAGGWSPAETRCVNIFSIILRTFILVLSTALLAREHNNKHQHLLAWESTNNKLDICVYAELEIFLCNVLSRLELVRGRTENRWEEERQPDVAEMLSVSPCLFFKDMTSLS